MLAESAQTAPVTTEKHHITFFRQSGWMMTAGLANGLLMWMVHPIVTRKFPVSEYGVFTTLLMVTTMMTTPAGGLQPVMAQQQAAAITDEKQRVVAAEYRGVLKALFLFWLVMVAVAAVFWKPALTGLKIQNPMALAITVVIGLAAMWMPLTQGILQGRQNFFWLGWTNIFNAVGRLGMICILVLAFNCWAAGAMAAVLTGMCVVIVIGLWLVRDVWKIPAAPVQWRDWLGRVIPLTLGLGAANFMIGTDMIFTQKYFPANQTGYYAVAATIGRALIFLTQPLTMVMFPKLARAKAAGEKSNALVLTLGTTLLAGGCAAIACTILPKLPLLIMGGQKYLVAAPLVPWYSWCMLPLAVSQVMVNSLMARSRFSIVPLLLIIAAGYAYALSCVGRHYGNNPDTFTGFRAMIQTLGISNFVLLVVCALFTWGRRGGSVETLKN